jgi:hypothetical protein
MTITEFLEARIAEDEAQAHNVLVFRMNPRTNMPGNQAIPARVRAECAAKRAILGIHKDREGDCEQCSDYGWFAVLDGPMDHEEFPCPTIRAITTIYKDHPDYRQEWAL